VLGGEATHTNFIVYGLTRPGLEPTIYRTRGEHVYSYTTDAKLYTSILSAVKTGLQSQLFLKGWCESEVDFATTD